MTPGSSFLDALKLASEQADKAEDEFRRSITARIKEFERERAFAHRRLNLMRAVSEAVASAESEEIAVASANGVLRVRLGWSSDSDARAEVLSRFAPVAQAIFASLAPDEAEESQPDVIATLAAFEKWYVETHPNPFWVLFEHYMPETPLVDF